MRDKHNECYDCKYKRSVPGNAHIRCSMPDPDMKGEAHCIKHGWFYYPERFDPDCKTVNCANFEEIE